MVDKSLAFPSFLLHTWHAEKVDHVLECNPSDQSDRVLHHDTRSSLLAKYIHCSYTLPSIVNLHNHRLDREAVSLRTDVGGHYFGFGKGLHKLSNEQDERFIYTDRAEKPDRVTCGKHPQPPCGVEASKAGCAWGRDTARCRHIPVC